MAFLKDLLKQIPDSIDIKTKFQLSVNFVNNLKNVETPQKLLLFVVALFVIEVIRV